MGLPISITAAIAIGYGVVTVMLAVVFQHEAITVPKILGVLLTVAGAAPLATRSK